LIISSEFLSDTKNANYQHSSQIQFVPVRSGQARADFFVRGDSRSCFIKQVKDYCFELSIPASLGDEKFPVSELFHEYEVGNAIWRTRRYLPSQYICLPGEETTIVSFDGQFVSYVSLLSRKAGGSEMYWIIVFPREA
jgi:hypothetical protein